MTIDATVIVAGVSVVGMAVAAIPTVADALDRRARRNAGIDPFGPGAAVRLCPGFDRRAGVVCVG
ncbi:MAG: hypothetical protein PHU26_10480 [Methanofollis liminatans]|jgi:hypothetical protein|nr:hypothetical protein [Methanofollis liminatans]